MVVLAVEAILLLLIECVWPLLLCVYSILCCVLYVVNDNVIDIVIII